MKKVLHLKECFLKNQSRYILDGLNSIEPNFKLAFYKMIRESKSVSNSQKYLTIKIF